MKIAKGFTLLELLVIIAIIGIFAAVALISLGGTRNKSADAAVKKTLTDSRSQAELFFAYNSTYTNVCSDVAGPPKSIYSQVISAAKIAGYSTVNSTLVGSAGVVTCHSVAAGWAVEVPLKAGGMFCVDNTGKAVTNPGTALQTSVTDTSC